jgi:Type I restriction-modification system methyltransferase subunit
MMPNMSKIENNGKSLESWLWDAACSIRGAKDAPKYKDYILPLVFTKRLCDVFDDELNRIAKKVGGRAKAFKVVKSDKERPLQNYFSVTLNSFQSLKTY